MIEGKILLDQRMKARIRARYEKHNIQAGILNDRPHRQARSRFTKSGKPAMGSHTNVAGMKARRKTRQVGPTIAQVSMELRRRTGINIFTAPFDRRPSAEVKRFRRALLKFFGAKQATSTLRKRAEELLVLAIKAPIKRREYGSNSRAWSVVKGFNRKFFDTGQLYQAIRARIKRIAGKR